MNNDVPVWVLIVAIVVLVGSVTVAYLSRPRRRRGQHTHQDARSARDRIAQIHAAEIRRYGAMLAAGIVTAGAAVWEWLRSHKTTTLGAAALVAGALAIAPMMMMPADGDLDAAQPRPLPTSEPSVPDTSRSPGAASESADPVEVEPAPVDPVPTGDESDPDPPSAGDAPDSGDEPGTNDRDRNPDRERGDKEDGDEDDRPGRGTDPEPPPGHEPDHPGNGPPDRHHDAPERGVCLPGDLPRFPIDLPVDVCAPVGRG